MAPLILLRRRRHAFRSSPLLPLLFLFSSLVTLTHAACYVAANGQVALLKDWVSCPGTASSNGIETCCLPGSVCGEDSICHVPASANPGNNSWYESGCTDSDYSNVVCRSNCQKFTSGYIKWVTDRSSWMCCGNEGCNGDKTQVFFQAVSPAKWRPITASAKTKTTSSRKTTSTTIRPSSSRPPPTSSSTSSAPAAQTSSTRPSNTARTSNKHRHGGGGGNTSRQHTSTTPTSGPAASSSAAAAAGSGGGTVSSNTGLSSGAKVGIGAAIGATGAAAILAALAAFCIFRRRRPHEVIIEKRILSQEPGHPSYAVSTELRSIRSARSELDNQSQFYAEPAIMGLGRASEIPDPHRTRYFEQPAPPPPPPLPPLPPLPDLPEVYAGGGPGDYRTTRDFGSASRMTRSTKDWASIRTTRDYRFAEPTSSRRESVRTTRDYRFADDPT